MGIVAGLAGVLAQHAIQRDGIDGLRSAGQELAIVFVARFRVEIGLRHEAAASLRSSRRGTVPSSSAAMSSTGTGHRRDGLAGPSKLHGCDASRSAPRIT